MQQLRTLIEFPPTFLFEKRAAARWPHGKRRRTAFDERVLLFEIFFDKLGSRRRHRNSQRTQPHAGHIQK